MYKPCPKAQQNLKQKASPKIYKTKNKFKLTKTKHYKAQCFMCNGLRVLFQRGGVERDAARGFLTLYSCFFVQVGKWFLPHLSVPFHPNSTIVTVSHPTPSPIFFPIPLPNLLPCPPPQIFSPAPLPVFTWLRSC